MASPYICCRIMSFHALVGLMYAPREGDQPSTPTPRTTQPASPLKYLEKDTELLSLGSTLGLGADHGHGTAGLGEAEARGSGHAGSRESGRGTQKAHGGLKQQSRSHGKKNSALEHFEDETSSWRLWAWMSKCRLGGGE